jgi:hypothetical protein
MIDEIDPDLKIEITREFLDNLFRLIAWNGHMCDLWETHCFLQAVYNAAGEPVDHDKLMKDLDQLQEVYAAYLDTAAYKQFVVLKDGR